MAATAVARVAVALLSKDVRRLLIGAAGAAFLGAVAIVFVVVTLLKSLVGFAAGTPGMALLPSVGGDPGPLAAEIPADQLAFMQEVASASACGLPWSVLAGIASVESGFGRNLGPSSAGAYGYGQFEPGTWIGYAPSGVPLRTNDPAQLLLPASERDDSSNFHFALPAMARYLCAMVASYGVALPPEEALKHAVFYYNHALSVPYNPNDAYVNDVLGFAARAGSGVGGVVPGQGRRPGLDDRLRLQTGLRRGAIQLGCPDPSRHRSDRDRRRERRARPELPGVLPGGGGRADARSVRR